MEYTTTTSDGNTSSRYEYPDYPVIPPADTNTSTSFWFPDTVKGDEFTAEWLAVKLGELGYRGTLTKEEPLYKDGNKIAGTKAISLMIG
jgi:hypothetical protein